MKNLSRSAGFTLIELMIVITIIGILAATLAPISTIFREKSGVAAGVASTCCIRTALELYRTEKGHFPDSISTHNDLVDRVRPNGCDLAKDNEGPLPAGYPILKSYECRSYAIDVLTGDWIDLDCTNYPSEGFPGYEAIFELNGIPGKESIITSRETCKLLDPAV